jgi:uncharacterized membrane protein YraQ (UPF0718 family)
VNIESIFWGALLRVAQALIQASPTILVGLFVAGIFGRLLGHAGTRRLFGCGTWRELPQAWLIGMFLPVCSLGMIPVARQMKRSGIAGGTILAFAMTAPLFNPLSMLYGLTLSEPLVILTFAFCSMIVVTVVGGVWNRLCAGTASEEPALPAVAHGVKRMTSILVVASREVVGPSLGYVVVALLGVAALCAVLPQGSLQSTMEHTNPYAPLAMTVVAIPAYASPMVAMSQLGSMFQHANSVGAAFVLLTLGAGINLGLLLWVFRNYGLVRGLSWMGLLLIVVLGLAYTIEAPLYPGEIEPPGHTHAFDIYCRPFDHAASDLPATVRSKLTEALHPFERVSLTVLASLAVVGLLLRALDRRWRIEDWLESPPEPSEGAPAWHNVNVAPRVLGLFALAGLVAFSVVGCFAYYPDPKVTFAEMSILRAEVLSAAYSGNQKHALHFIPVWDDWTRRLQVGSFLREGPLSPYRRMKAKLFRDRLEFLKHAVEEGDREEAREYGGGVERAYGRMRQAYLEAS